MEDWDYSETTRNLKKEWDNNEEEKSKAAAELLRELLAKEKGLTSPDFDLTPAQEEC